MLRVEHTHARLPRTHSLTHTGALPYSHSLTLVYSLRQTFVLLLTCMLTLTPLEQSLILHTLILSFSLPLGNRSIFGFGSFSNGGNWDRVAGSIHLAVKA